MLTRMHKYIEDKTGATMIEYGLIAALIAVVLIGVLTTLGGDLNTMFGEVSAGVQNAGTGAAS